MYTPLSTIGARASLIPVGSLLGPWLIGLVISSIVFGITCLQVYLYYTKFSSRDPVYLKAFVALLMILDIVHLVLLTTSYYVTSVINFGDYRAISTAPWSLQAQIVVGVLLSTLVQMFYAFRVWSLWNKSPYMPAAIVICSLVQLGLAIAYMVAAVEVAAFKDTSVLLPFSTSALAFEVATDILISGSMIYRLVRSQTGFHKTNQALNTLTAYAINSGLLVMVFAICCLASFITSTTSLIYGLFFFILVRRE
ncbi:hypothetical protein FB451DRAFT_1213806 [Mycena latifolia]|nr:hypothetical protein FB451DRAFT_1213806 [Mycena latifolia]